MRRIRTKALAISAGIAAAGLGAVPAASAASAATPAPAKSVVCDGNDFGIGCFDPDGDHIIVEDFDSDGWRIEVQWQTDYGRSGVCAIQAGKDFRDCNYNMAENHEIYFEVHAINEKFELHEVIGGGSALI